MNRIIAILCLVTFLGNSQCHPLLAVAKHNRALASLLAVSASAESTAPNGIDSYYDDESEVTIWKGGTIDQPVNISTGIINLTGTVRITGKGSLTLSGGLLAIKKNAVLEGNLNIIKQGEFTNRGTVKGIVTIDADVLPQRMESNHNLYTPDNLLNCENGRIRTIIFKSGNALNVGRADSVFVSGGVLGNWMGEIGKANISGEGSIENGNGARIETVEVNDNSRLYNGPEGVDENGKPFKMASIGTVTVNTKIRDDLNVFNSGDITNIIQNSGHVGNNGSVGAFTVNGGKASVWDDALYNSNATWKPVVKSFTINNGDINVNSSTVQFMNIINGTVGIEKSKINTAVVEADGRLTIDKSNIDILYVNGNFIPFQNDDTPSVNAVSWEGSKVGNIILLGDSKFENGGKAEKVTIDCNPLKEFQTISGTPQAGANYINYGSTGELRQFNGNSYINGSVNKGYLIHGNLNNDSDGHIEKLYVEGGEVKDDTGGTIASREPFQHSGWKQASEIAVSSQFVNGEFNHSNSMKKAADLPNGGFYTDKKTYNDIWFKIHLEEKSELSASFQALESTGCLLIQTPEGNLLSANSTGSLKTLSMTAETTGTYYVRIIGGQNGYILKTTISRPARISCVFQKQYAVDEGVSPMVTNEDVSDYNIQIFNITKGTALTDVEFKTGDIYLSASQASAGDIIRFTLESFTGDIAPLSETVKLSSDATALITLKAMQMGHMTALCENQQGVNGFLFNASGNFVQSLSLDNYGVMVTEKLEAGTYQVVFIQGSKSLWALSNVKDYKVFGLKEGQDYIKKEFQVRDGFITTLGKLTVPKMSENLESALVRDTTIYSSNCEIVSPGKLVTMRLSYQLKDTYAKSAEDIQAVFELPEGSGYIPGSLVVDGSPQKNVILEDNKVIVPLKKDGGLIIFYIKPDGTNPLITSTASLRFKKSGASFAELAGSVNIEIPVISISGPLNTSNSQVNLSGTGVPGTLVSIYDGLQKVGEVKCNKAGSWHTGINLATGSESVHMITARIYTGTENEVSSEALAIKYDKAMVDVTELAIYYNAHTPQKIVLTKETLGIARPRLTMYPGTPFTFTIKATNSNRVDRMYVVSTKNGERKTMEASYDTANGLWTANGHFDETNHNYLPGKLSVEYVLKETDASTVQESQVDPRDVEFSNLSDEWQNADMEIMENTFTDSGNSGRIKVHYTLADDKKTDVYSTIGVTRKPAETTPEELIAAGYQKVTLDDGSIGYTITLANTEGTALRTEVIHFYKGDTATGASLSTMGLRLGLAGPSTVLTRLPVRYAATTDAGYFQESFFTEVAGKVGEMDVEMAVKFVGGGELAAKSAGTATGILTTLIDAYNTIDGYADSYAINAQAQQKVINSPQMTADQKNHYLQQLNNNNHEMFSLMGMKLAYMGTFAALGIMGGILLSGAAVPALLISGFTFGAAIMGGMIFNKEREKLKKDMDRILKELEDPLVVIVVDPNYEYDPSGYVYEAVPSNRLQDVQATAYYQKNGKAVLWDAGEYDQENPLITDSEGKYAWDVPEGQWQVRYELDGYETTTSEWLPVPPPQTEVNIGMVSKAAPSIEWANLYAPYVELQFSKYMKVDSLTVNSITLTHPSGKPVNFKIEAANAEAAGDGSGIMLASRFHLVFDGKGPARGEKYNLSITDALVSYAGVPVKADTFELSCRQLFTDLKVDPAQTVSVGETVRIPVILGPKGNGKGLEIMNNSEESDLCKVISIGNFDRKGRAIVEVQGLLPGEVTLKFSVPGTALKAETRVSVIQFAPASTENAPLTEKLPRTVLWILIGIVSIGLIILIMWKLNNRKNCNKDNSR